MQEPQTPTQAAPNRQSALPPPSPPPMVPQVMPQQQPQLLPQQPNVVVAMPPQRPQEAEESCWQKGCFCCCCFCPTWLAFVIIMLFILTGSVIPWIMKLIQDHTSNKGGSTRAQYSWDGAEAYSVAGDKEVLDYTMETTKSTGSGWVTSAASRAVL